MSVQPKETAIFEAVYDARNPFRGIAEHDLNMRLMREPLGGRCMQRWLDLDRDDPTSIWSEKCDGFATVRSRLDENVVLPREKEPE
jgi:hypothetical protein